MAVKERQQFLLRLLNDAALRKRFFSGRSDFGLSKRDEALVRAIARTDIERKAAGLAKKKSRLQEGQ